MVPSRPLLALLCLAFATALTSAEPVVYDIGDFTAPGTTASWLHTGHMDRTHHLDGEITAFRDLDAGLIEFTGGVLDAESLGLPGTLFGGFDQALDLEIEVTGGSIRAFGRSGRALGHLETLFHQPGADDAIVFLYFAPFHFHGPANRFLDPDLNSFAVWSDVAVYSRGHASFHPSLRVGATLYATTATGGIASVTHNPEPGTVVLVGALLTGAAARHRARRRRRALAA